MSAPLCWRIAWLFCLWSLVAFAANPIWDEATRIRRNVRETGYQHQTFVDEAQGRYFLDCSGFLNYVLTRTLPVEFMELERGLLSDKGKSTRRLLARDYVAFFGVLASGSSTKVSAWEAVANPDRLRPGDILAWLSRANDPSGNTGHVMVVNGMPVPVHDSAEVWVPVMDATSHPHGTSDPRRASSSGGLGEAIVVVLIDQSGRAVGHRWSTDSDETELWTRIGMGRLRAH